MNGPRLLAQIVKELLSVLRDPRSRYILIGPPLIQLVILSFAVTLDVRNVSLVVRDLDGGPAAQQLVSSLDAAAFSGRLAMVTSGPEVREAIDTGEALAAVIIPEGYSADITSDRATTVQIILDGRRANAAQLTAAYVQAVVSAQGTAGLIEAPADVAPVRHWFNPSLIYRWFVVPSLAGILLTFTAMLLTALSIARERELGTFDQLLVSPTTPAEIIIAKCAPAMLVAPTLGILMMLAGAFAFGIPFTGSVLAIGLALPVFALALVGIGLMVSAVSANQQQAILGTFAIGVPTILMSGFATPIENMPTVLQWIAEAIPTRHFLVIVQGVFLKGHGVPEIWPHLWPMALIGAVTLTGATLLVRSRLS
jgi:ABC-2 type transport system permease protein